MASCSIYTPIVQNPRNPCITRMHPVLEFLRENPVSALEKHGIYARWSNSNPRKVSLNYNQIEARDGDVLVEHCRGLVLRQMGDGDPGAPGEYKVLARPMRRFYNLGAQAASPIDWETVRFEEKLDGTMCIVYRDPDLDRLCVATRSIPDADIPNSQGDSFSDLFWRHAGEVSVPDGMTYCYELTGPDNQIVVPYDDWTITRLAAINNLTGEEETGSSVRTYTFANLADALDWLNRQPGHSLEGFVARDAQNRRVKIKSSQYLAVARVLTASGSDEGLVNVILSGTADDVRSILPAPRAARMDLFAERIREWASYLESQVGELRAIQDRKTVALRIQADPKMAPWMGTLMMMWSGRAQNISTWLDQSKKDGAFPPSLVEKITEFISTP